MTTITTKQGNTIVLEISSCAVYAKINNNAYKVDSFDYVSGKVALVGCNDKFILGEVDKVILASKIDRATYGEWVDGYFPEPFRILS